MNMSDETVAKLLAGALQQPPLSELSVARMRERVQSDWRDQLRQTQQARTQRWAGLVAACLIGAAVLTWWSPRPSSAVMGIVANEFAGGIVVTHPEPAAGPALRATTLRVGQSVDAKASTVIKLSNGGYLKMQAGSALAFDSAAEINLRNGTIYLDFDPGVAHTALHIRTPFAVVQHLGTQYEVALSPAQLRVRVREGTVQIKGAIAARAQAGEELTISPGSALQRRAIASYGNEWSWVDSLSGNFEAEGQSILQLLHWVARETGRRVEFADESVNQVAARAILHGSIRGLSPDVALRAMLSTTSLVADVRTDVIIISSAAPVPALQP